MNWVTIVKLNRLPSKCSLRTDSLAEIDFSHHLHYLTLPPLIVIQKVLYSAWEPKPIIYEQSKPPTTFLRKLLRAHHDCLFLQHKGGYFARTGYGAKSLRRAARIHQLHVVRWISNLNGAWRNILWNTWAKENHEFRIFCPYHWNSLDHLRRRI